MGVFWRKCEATRAHLAGRTQRLFMLKADELVAASRDSGCADLDGAQTELVAAVCELGRKMATPQRAIACASALARCFDAYRMHSVALRQSLEYAVRAAFDALLEDPLRVFPDWLHWLQARATRRIDDSRSWTIIVAGLCSFLRDATECAALDAAALQRHEVCCLVFELLQWIVVHGSEGERTVLRAAMADMDACVALYPLARLPHAALFRVVMVQMLQTLMEPEPECEIVQVVLAEE